MSAIAWRANARSDQDHDQSRANDICEHPITIIAILVRLLVRAAGLIVPPFAQPGGIALRIDGRHAPALARGRSVTTRSP